MAAAAVQTPLVFARSKSAYHGPDPLVVEGQLARLRQIRKELGLALMSETFFWILRKNPEKGEKDILAGRTKAWNKNLVPFRHNRIQKDLDEKMTGRDILLKPRQAGYTTYMIIMGLLLPVILEPGTNSMLISQNNNYAAKHFRMLLRALQHFGKIDPYNRYANTGYYALKDHLLHTTYSSRTEVIFDQLDSMVMVGSAEVEEVGQGVTLHHLGCTEVARWPGNPEETLANVKESVASGGTIAMESTANMMGGYFYEECMRARDKKPGREFTYHFHEWWWHEEYTKDITEKEEEELSKTLTKEEVSLMEVKGLTAGQIAWRREKIESLRHNFWEKYPEDDLSCFLSHGKNFFDMTILRQRRVEVENIVPLEKYKRLKIYKQRIKHREYIIGADVASGIDAAGEDAQESNLDYSTAVVIDKETGEEMAAYRGRVKPEDFAHDLAEIGRRYNNALIAVERNGDGGTVITCLMVVNQYMNIYKHKDWWKRDRQKLKEIEGFPTTTKNRPLACNRVKHFVEESPELIYDKKFLDEAATFVHSGKGKPEAAEGYHDDTVMCRGIAYYVRYWRLGYFVPEALKKESYGQMPQEFMDDAELELESEPEE